MVFFGTIQLDKNDETGRWDLVDGQQRLTTFLLLISILREKNQNKAMEYYDSIDFKRLKDSLDWATPNNTEEMIHDSKYVINRGILSDKLDKSTAATKEGDDFYKNYEQYILDSVYFVCLNTSDLSLSDVVNVFNTINTTGMDLNVSDVFKFRYFDYLNSIEKKNQWMDLINDCYERIEKDNVKRVNSRQAKIEMSWILDIYKHIICAYCDEIGMSDAGKSNAQFFDDLLHNDKYEVKRKKCAKVLSFDSFSKLVDIFLDFWRWYELLVDDQIVMEYYSLPLIYETRYENSGQFRLLSRSLS